MGLPKGKIDFNKIIAGQATEILDIILGVGEEWFISIINYTSCAGLMIACVVWDADAAEQEDVVYLFASNTSVEVQNNFIIKGDGLKKLRLVIENVDTVSHVGVLNIFYEEILTS